MATLKVSEEQHNYTLADLFITALLVGAIIQLAVWLML